MAEKNKNKNMELREFVTTVLSDLVNAVEDADKESVRSIHLSQNTSNRTVEFDIAVTAENEFSSGGKAGVKVINFFEIKGGAEGATRNSTVSRIQFGVTIDTSTKEQHAQFASQAVSRRNNIESDF
jgi:hypothetical protein